MIKTVIDGDGHLDLDEPAIRKRMPKEFASLRGALFPPVDHLHTCNPFQSLPGAFADGDPESWLEFADAVGIQSAAIYPTSRAGFVVNRDWAIALSRAYNDWLYDTFLCRSPRFLGMGLLPMQEPQAAAEELHRIVTELGFKGAVLPATGLASPLGNKIYWPVYEEANRLKAAMAIHGGMHVRLGLDQMEVYAAVNALGHPISQVIQFASLAFAGLFDRYSDTRWAFLEAGVSWLQVALERFDRAYETHVPIDLRGEYMQLQEGETVSNYISRNIKEGRIFVGCEGDEQYIPDMVRSMGCNPAFFSSDFPHETTADRCLHQIEELRANTNLAEADREALLSGNAARFYRLNGS